MRVDVLVDPCLHACASWWLITGMEHVSNLIIFLFVSVGYSLRTARW